MKKIYPVSVPQEGLRDLPEKMTSFQKNFLGKP